MNETKIPIKELVNGNVYLQELGMPFKSFKYIARLNHTEKNNLFDSSYICLGEKDDSHSFTSESIDELNYDYLSILRPATDEEAQWLIECEKANYFIERKKALNINNLTEKEIFSLNGNHLEKTWAKETSETKKIPNNEKLDFKGRVLKEFKIGKWYSNPDSTLMDYGRVFKTEVIEDIITNYYYNEIFFDRTITNNKEKECPLLLSQINANLDYNMIEVNYNDIKPICTEQIKESLTISTQLLIDIKKLSTALKDFEKSLELFSN